MITGGARPFTLNQRVLVVLVSFCRQYRTEITMPFFIFSADPNIPCGSQCGCMVSCSLPCCPIFSGAAETCGLISSSLLVEEIPPAHPLGKLFKLSHHVLLIYVGATVWHSHGRMCHWHKINRVVSSTSNL